MPTLSITEISDLIKLFTYIVAFICTIIFMYWKH